MADFGVRMAFHHHMGTIVETDAEVDRLMTETGPAVGLLYDTGHSVFSGGDPIALLSRNVGRVVHVHCKDARKDLLKGPGQGQKFHAGGARRRLHRARRRLHRLPDDPLLLHDAGYAGWLVCEAEQDPGKAHPLTYARMGFQNLSNMASEAGFSVDETRVG